MKKLRIAIVVRRFPKVSETFVIQHIVMLLKAGHDVDIYSFKPPEKAVPLHQDVKEYRLMEKTYYYPPRPVGKENRCEYFARIQMRYRTSHRQWIHRCQQPQNRMYNNLYYTEPFLDKHYHIVHCHFGPVANRVILLKDVFPETKFYVTFHGYGIRLGRKRGGEIYRTLFARADGIIAVCDYSASQLRRLGCPEEKIIFLPNCVDTTRFTCRKYGSKQVFNILSIARLSHGKNIPFALNIMMAVKNEQKFDFRYHIIGDGPLRAHMEEMIKAHGLEDHVVLLGALNDQRVREQLAFTDLLFLPSATEAFPVCILEAQAMGVPVIATDVGGVGQGLIDGKTGFLIELNHVEQAKQKMYTMFQDPSLIERMGQNARQFIEENFSAYEHSRRLQQIYVKGTAA